jgi:hypothetical protein
MVTILQLFAVDEFWWEIYTVIYFIHGMARLMNLLSVAKLSEKAIPPFIICRE